MTHTKNYIHPNFILGLASYLLLLIGVVLNTGESDLAKSMILGSFVLGSAHWLWSLASVSKDVELSGKDDGKGFWLALMIMIPPLAGMMYYMLHDKRVQW